MYGLNNDYLLTAKRLVCKFIDTTNPSKEPIERNGTCFFVRNKHGHTCLVTNRHMLDINFNQKEPKYKDYQLLLANVSFKTKNIDTGIPDIDTDLAIINPFNIIYSKNSENDIACIVSPKFIHPGIKEFSINQYVPYEMIANEEDLQSKLTICDFVAFPGFPDWHDRKNNMPIIRMGTIASDPRLDYSETNNFTGNKIAYEAFSHSGSSGSPVYAISKGINVSGGLQGGNYRSEMLVGINAGHFDNRGNHEKIHSGLSYFVKSSVLFEMIDK